MIHDIGVPVDIYMLTVSEVKCGGKFQKILLMGQAYRVGDS